MTNHYPILGAQFVDYTQEFMKALQMRQFLENFMEQQRARREEQQNPLAAGIARGATGTMERGYEAGLGEDPTFREQVGRLYRIPQGQLGGLTAPGKIRNRQAAREAIARTRGIIAEHITRARVLGQIAPYLAPETLQKFPPETRKQFQGFLGRDPTQEVLSQAMQAVDDLGRQMPPDALNDPMVQREFNDLYELIRRLSGGPFAGGGSTLGNLLGGGGTPTPTPSITSPGAPSVTPQLPGVQFPGQ